MASHGSEPLVSPPSNDGFRSVYDATLPDVWGFVLGRVGGDSGVAEDIVAETYLAAAQRYRQGDDITIRWLIVVARRRIVDHWRTEGRIARRIHRLQREPTAAPRDIADRESERERVEQALRRLKPIHRNALLMFHLEGFSVREVAEVLERSDKATESMLARARSAFRNAYEDEA